MPRVLHLDPKVESDSSFAALQASLGEIGPKTARLPGNQSKTAGRVNRSQSRSRNRLFAQAGYEFRPQFFAEVKENFGAAPAIVDFAHDASAATRKINDWVAQQTRERIRRFDSATARSRHASGPRKRALSQGALGQQVPTDVTRPKPFHIRGQNAVDLPTMQKVAQLRYAKRKGFSAVALPYSGGDLQFVVLIPDEVDGLGRLENQLTADLLNDCAKMNTSEALLHLPKEGQPP